MHELENHSGFSEQSAPGEWQEVDASTRLCPNQPHRTILSQETLQDLIEVSS